MPLPLEELKVKVSPIISKEEIDKWFQNATMLAAKGAFVGGLCKNITTKHKPQTI